MTLWTRFLAYFCLVLFDFFSLFNISIVLFSMEQLCLYFLWKIINWTSHLVVFTLHPSISSLSFKSEHLVKLLNISKLRAEMSVENVLDLISRMCLRLQNIHLCFTFWFILVSVSKSCFCKSFPWNLRLCQKTDNIPDHTTQTLVKYILITGSN